MSNVRSEIWNTFWQFALSLLLFNTPAFVGFSNYDTLAWSVVVCSLILIIFFLGRRYVSLSPGLIERKNIWRLMGLIVLTVVANIFFELSILDFPFYHNIFPEEWAELLEDDMQMTLPLYLDACLLAPIAEEIAFRGVFLGGLLRMQCNPWLAILISTIIYYKLSLDKGRCQCQSGTALISDSPDGIRRNESFFQSYPPKCYKTTEHLFRLSPRQTLFRSCRGFFVGLSVTLWLGITLGGGYSMM